MPYFSSASKERLVTCHPELIKLFEIVVGLYDCAILCGHRNKEEQDKAYQMGFSQVQWPNGKHNSLPSRAVDVAPCLNGKPEMKDREQITHFAGVVLGIANMIGVKLRWGGDWDSDHDLADNKFDDLFHFELAEK